MGALGIPLVSMVAVVRADVLGENGLLQKVGRCRE